MRNFSKAIVIVVIFAILSVAHLGCNKSSDDSNGGGKNGPSGKNVDLKEPGEGVAYNLTILHTNDLHGAIRPFGRYDVGGLARHAWLNSEIRSRNEEIGVPTLILNAGDTRDGTTFNDGTETSGVWAVMNLIGYDATQIGNHDQFFGGQTLFSNLVAAFGDDVTVDQFGNTIARQNMKVLWGNVNTARINNCPDFPYVSETYKRAVESAFVAPEDDPCDADSYPSDIDPSLMGPPDDPSTFLIHQAVFYNYGGLKVGVFGLVTDEAIYKIIPGSPLSVLGYKVPEGIYNEGAVIYSPDSAKSHYVNGMIDYLADPDGDPATSDGADVIICLSHAGLDDDQRMAQDALGPVSGRHVDVVVGGHSHTQVNRALEYDNVGGGKSWVVQADWGGIFLGRVDLLVAGGSVSVVNSGLIPVDSNVPEVKEVTQLINHIYSMDGGVNDFFENVYGVKPTDLVGRSEIDLNYTDYYGETPLTNLLADAFLWQGQSESLFTIPNNGNPEAGLPGYLDAAVVVPFVLHGEETILKGPLTVESMLDTLHIHDFTTDPTHGDTMHVVELTPNPDGIDFAGLHFASSPHFILELIFSIGDLLGGSSLAALVNSYLGSLQFRGIDFQVDFSKPLFQRIASDSIFINGEAVDPTKYYYFSLNSTIAQFLGSVGAVIAGSVSFMNWDRSWSETNMPEWVALMNYIHDGVLHSVITPDLVAVKGQGMQTIGPDLTLQPWDITFTPEHPRAGDTVTITAVILNTGYTPVVQANIDYVYNNTPTKLDDDPDGLTDAITGYSNITIGTDIVNNVPAFDVTPGSAITSGLAWTIPSDLPAGKYFICPTITLVDPDPSTERLQGNNGGSGLCAALEVQ